MKGPTAKELQGLLNKLIKQDNLALLRDLSILTTLWDYKDFKEILKKRIKELEGKQEWHTVAEGEAKKPWEAPDEFKEG